MSRLETDGPLMRTVRHPGHPLHNRSTVIDCASLRSESLDVPENGDLFACLEAEVDRRDAAGAFFRLIGGGAISALTIMTGGPGVSTPMTFHGPLTLVTPVRVETGAGVIGVDQDGSRFTHCHAVFRDQAERLVGGHLRKGKATVGFGGLRVEFFALYGARFAVRIDPETEFPLLHPELTRR